MKRPALILNLIVVALALLGFWRLGFGALGYAVNDSGASVSQEENRERLVRYEIPRLGIVQPIVTNALRPELGTGPAYVLNSPMEGQLSILVGRMGQSPSLLAYVQPGDRIHLITEDGATSVFLVEETGRGAMQSHKLVQAPLVFSSVDAGGNPVWLTAGRADIGSETRVGSR